MPLSFVDDRADAAMLPARSLAESPNSSDSSKPTRRRNRVVESHAVAIAAAAGIACALASPEPTGTGGVDAVLRFAAAALVVYAAASAPWWALTVSAAAATALAGAFVPSAMAAAAAVIALVIGAGQRSRPDWRAISAALTVNALARAELEPRFGVTTAVAVAFGLLLLVSGMRRRPSSIRTPMKRALIGIGGLAVIATVAFALEALAARSALADGRAEAQLAVTSVQRGDYGAAATHFANAAGHFESSQRHLDRPWASPAAAVPFVAQHRNLIYNLSDSGAEQAEAAAGAVAAIDPDRLRLTAGTIDLDGIAALEAPIDTLYGALDRLAASLDGADSPWLVPSLRREVTRLSDDLDENVQRLDDAAAAVDLAPGLLGADGPRRYLVLFTTPAEARGLGGFVGNYAVLTAEAGHLEMTEFGRVSDLEILGQALGVRIAGPAEFLSRYGTFGYNTDGDGLVGNAAWRNVTMSPDFASVAEVTASMYEQITAPVTDAPVDGVIVMDPYVIGSLLGYTGPLPLTTVDFTVDATNAAQYILVDQYMAANHVDRIDALDEIARRTVESLLSGVMPGPSTLAADLGPHVADRRLAIWAARPDEQELLRSLGMLGEIPSLAGHDGWSVAVTNAGGSKIDSFLERNFSYDATTRGDETTALLSATLRNTAPATGLPDYVIGNVLGMPSGTSRLYVSFYSALELESATLDGQSVELAHSTEAGWHVYSGYVTLAAGQQATFDVRLRGHVELPGDPVTWTQPLVRPAIID